MASNYQKLNGDHRGDQDVRSKTFSNPQRTRPMKETYNMNQSYGPGGIGSQGLPTEMERPTDIHSTPADMMSRRQNQFPGGGMSQHPSQFRRPPGKRNPVPDMADQYMTDYRNPVIPSDYSTSEQVQHIANQIHQLFQEINEIKGFAGLINDMNFKLEQVIEQNNDIRDVVDDIQFDVSSMKKQTPQQDNGRLDRMYDERIPPEVIPTITPSEVKLTRTPPDVISTKSHPEVIQTKIPTEVIQTRIPPEVIPTRTTPEDIRPQIPSEIVQTNPQQSGYAHSMLNTNENSTDIRPGQSSPVTVQNRDDLVNNRMHLSQDEPSIKNERSMDESKRDTTPPSVINETQPVSVTEGEKNAEKISVGTAMSLQMTDRQYKCKKTLESEDNRLNYFDDEEPEPIPVVRVAPHPRPRSPEERDTDLKERDDVKVQQTTGNDRKEKVTEITDERDLAIPKEDHYLEQLALTENNKAKDCLDPKSNGADTIICIDTSDSMAGEPLRKSIEFVNQFVDYVEQWAEKYQIEENVAIVRFGREARIIQHVTNDYNKVRDALEKLDTGGPTPMMTGLVISMSALFNRGGPVTVHDRQVNPRVILLSDGKATDHRIFEGPDIMQPNGLPEHLIKEKLNDFAERVKLENRTIICVPVGNNPKMDILNPLAEITGGFVSSVENVKKISRSFFVEVMISQTRYEGITDEIKTNRQEIAAIVRNLQNGKDVTEAEMNEIVTRVIKETEEQIEIERLREQQRMEIDEESEMEAGLRVRRGKDWMWGDQDGFGTGTVIGHRSRGYVRVKWDCGNVGRYRHGAQGAYDLEVVDEPRMLPDDVLIAEGVYVVKGRDWEWHDQDGGGEDAVGCVYYFEDEGIVHVRWENGIRGNYRFGGFGKIDLQILTPRDYEKLKIKRQKRAQQEAEYQAYGYATSQNIQTDRPSSPNIQTDGPLSPNIQTDGPTSPNIQTDGPISPYLPTDGRTSPKIEKDGLTNSSTPVVTPNISNSQTLGLNISNIQSEDSSSSSNHKSGDSSYMKPDIREPIPLDTSAETNGSVGIWQYGLNNEWTNFTDTDNERIEKMYSVKKTGMVVIKNDKGENCRVILNKMKYKNTKTGEEIDIRRL